MVRFQKRNGKYEAKATTEFQGRKVNVHIKLWQLDDTRWTWEIVWPTQAALAWGETRKTRDGAKAEVNRQIVNGFRRIRLAGRTLIVVR